MVVFAAVSPADITSYCQISEYPRSDWRRCRRPLFSAAGIDDYPDAVFRLGSNTGDDSGDYPELSPLCRVSRPVCDHYSFFVIGDRQLGRLQGIRNPAFRDVIRTGQGEYPANVLAGI